MIATQGSELPTANLYYTEGASDKIYQCSIRPSGVGFIVDFAYGRRGKNLQTGTKTSEPVSHDKALKIFEGLVREKKAKGYTESETGAVFTTDEHAGQSSGLSCQLLNSVERDELNKYILNPSFVMQQKHDGERLLVIKKGWEVKGVNRKGLFTSLNPIIKEELLSITADFILDGEIVGDHYHLFDVLDVGGVDLRDLPYSNRLLSLTSIDLTKVTHCRIVETHVSAKEKLAFFEKAEMSNMEGVVLKDITASYTPGRPNSGGSQIKFKFYSTASVIVTSVNLKRSVSIAVVDSGEFVSVGNVTILSNHEIPNVGDVIEVRYLYAYKGGSLFQPTFLGLRRDVDKVECVLSQLKYKAD